MRLRHAGPAAALGLVGLGGGFVATRRWLLGRLRYRLDGFPSAPVPSIRLHVVERLGLRTFYSQLGQDKWVLGVMFPRVSNGYFVDVGAADARDGSNTLALEEAGWSGICVEPFPTGDWTARRAQLFRDVVYRTAGEAVEFRTAGRHGGIDDHIEAWRTDVDDASIAKLHTTTLADVLSRAGAPPYIEYLSLDTEGSELEVLRGFPFDRYRVGALTIEHNGEEPKRSEIRELLRSHGYRFVREHVVEDWYADAGLPPGFRQRWCAKLAVR